MGYIGNVRPTIALVADDITDGAITAAKLGTNAVTSAKIAADAVTGAKIADNAVVGSHAGESFGNRNLLINGSGQINQRHGTATNTSVNSYAMDRWRTYGGPNTFTLATRSDAGAGEGDQYYIRYQRNNGDSGTNAYGLCQGIETRDSKFCAGKTVALSFRARVGANWSATNFTAVVQGGEGTDQNPVAMTNTGNIIVLTPTLTTSWATYSATGAVPSDKTQLTVAFQFNPVGTAGAADYLDIREIQLEIGDAPTPFEYRSYSEELYRCLRYLWVTGVTQDKVFFHGHVADNDTFRCHVQFPVDMRATPTIVSTTGAWRVANASLNTSYSNAWTFGGDYKGGQVTMSDSGGTDMSSHQKPGYTHPHVSGTSIRFDAEL